MSLHNIPNNLDNNAYYLAVQAPFQALIGLITHQLSGNTPEEASSGQAWANYVLPVPHPGEPTMNYKGRISAEYLRFESITKTLTGLVGALTYLPAQSPVTLFSPSSQQDELSLLTTSFGTLQLHNAGTETQTKLQYYHAVKTHFFTCTQRMQHHMGQMLVHDPERHNYQTAWSSYSLTPPEDQETDQEYKIRATEEFWRIFGVAKRMQQLYLAAHPAHQTSSSLIQQFH